MAKTAAIVGTAQATRNAVNRHSAQKDAQAYANASNAVYNQAPPPQQGYAPPPQQGYAPPPQEQYQEQAVQEEDSIAKLERLSALYAQGMLTDQEFAAAKAKLLA
jgi:hypothetical protein